MLMSYPVMLSLIGIAFLLFAGAMAGLGIWTYRDAKARGLEAGIWTAVVVLVPNLIGFLLYFMVGRKHQKTVCPACGELTEPGKAYCSSCGTPAGPGSHLPALPRHKGKKPLILSLVCIVLGFFLIIGIILANFAASPETFMTRNISIVQTQTVRPGVWKLSFWYFDGEKARAIKLRQDGSRIMNIDASIESGTVEAGISVDGKEEQRLSLNELESPYAWDLSGYPDHAKLSLRLYADDAKGKINMKWEQ
ncbi:MAG: hypothetical protein K0R57_2262 [Paenibacillaceae bacterium]|jgi:hypothetical protein|nr:hypothetical protein [Paenibacillaceae bacterium]